MLSSYRFSIFLIFNFNASFSVVSFWVSRLALPTFSSNSPTRIFLSLCKSRKYPSCSSKSLILLAYCPDAYCDCFILSAVIFLISDWQLSLSASKRLTSTLPSYTVWAYLPFHCQSYRRRSSISCLIFSRYLVSSMYSLYSFSVLLRCSFNFYKYSFSIYMSLSISVILDMGVLKRSAVDRDCDLNELQSIIKCQKYAKIYFTQQQSHQRGVQNNHQFKVSLTYSQMHAEGYPTASRQLLQVILYLPMSLQKPTQSFLSSQTQKYASLFKYYYATINPSQTPKIEASPPSKPTLRKTKFVLPSINKKLYTEEAFDLEDIIKSRVQLQNTVLKLKSRHFAPQGASKTRKLQMIRSKRVAQNSNESLRLISHKKTMKELSPFKSSKSQEIASCTLEESMLYG